MIDGKRPSGCVSSMPRRSFTERQEALERAVPQPARRRLLRMRAWAYRSRASVASRRQASGSGSPDGPGALEGVVILGMHRSGTSLITRLVSLLGLSLCREQDLLVGRKANPRGHWESRSLLNFDDELLDELGGAWYCPPRLGSEQLSRLLDRHRAAGLAKVRDAHPQHPWVWKDPRASLLLPFWSAVLQQRAAYVLVVRHPLEVSDSLARRDGYSRALSLALWERYTRQAMLGAAGRPMMVCTYDAVLDDPIGWCERLVAFLGEIGAPGLAVDRTVAGAFTMDGLRSSRQSWTELQPGPLISAERVALARAASAPTAQTSYVPPELPAETAETEAVFAEIRERVAREDGWPRQLERLSTRFVSRRAAAPATGPDAEPPISVLLTPSDPVGAQESLPALATTLPAGSEILTIEQAEGGLGEAKALAQAAREARGRIVILTRAGTPRCEGWCEHVERALAARRVAAVGPVMRFRSCPDRRHFGLVFADDDLVAHAVLGRAASVPVSVALLSGSHCAFDRRVLSAAGGIDEEFGSAEGAIAELSVRLWRMGFRCSVIPELEVWAEQAGDDATELYDRLRIAALHFDAAHLQAFEDRARRLPSYEQAAVRLAISDVEHRRAVIAATCVFPIARYFESFPPR